MFSDWLAIPRITEKILKAEWVFSSWKSMGVVLMNILCRHCEMFISVSQIILMISNTLLINSFFRLYHPDKGIYFGISVTGYMVLCVKALIYPYIHILFWSNIWIEVYISDWHITLKFIFQFCKSDIFWWLLFSPDWFDTHTQEYYKEYALLFSFIIFNIKKSSFYVTSSFQVVDAHNKNKYG